jgi:hypothetical protein
MVSVTRVAIPGIALWRATQKRGDDEPGHPRDRRGHRSTERRDSGAFKPPSAALGVAALNPRDIRPLRPARRPASAGVPRISEFYGIVIEMYFDDHPPPHFHARYAGDVAKIEIATGAVIVGSLPPRALRLVREWLELHRAELEANWERAERLETPQPIEPLR